MKKEEGKREEEGMGGEKGEGGGEREGGGGGFFFQAEDGIRDYDVTGVQTCALPISSMLGIVAMLGAALLARRRD